MLKTSSVSVRAGVIAALALSGALSANQAYALCTFGGSGEPSLQAALDGLLSGGAPDVQTDCLNDGSDAGWRTIASTGEIEISIELAGNAGSNEFGVYDLNSGTARTIFEGSDGVGSSATVRFGWNAAASEWRVRFREETDAADLWDRLSLTTSAFGFFLRSNAQAATFYSQTHRNADGLDHMYAYRGNDSVFAFGEFEDELFLATDYLLAWDDTLAPGGDRDYQDFVALLRDFSPVTPVPLPTAVWLLATGLIGLAGVARRKA